MVPIEVLLHRGLYVVETSVSLPGQLTEPNYRGLIDTGANVTCISPGVISDLAAAPVGKSDYIVADGETRVANKYVLSISLRFAVTTGADNDRFFQSPHLLDVLDLVEPNSTYDVILGTDFLRRFHIAMEAEQALISPSATAWRQ